MNVARSIRPILFPFTRAARLAKATSPSPHWGLVSLLHTYRDNPEAFNVLASLDREVSDIEHRRADAARAAFNRLMDTHLSGRSEAERRAIVEEVWRRAPVEPAAAPESYGWSESPDVPTETMERFHAFVEQLARAKLLGDPLPRW